jgi:hypothetical protein
MFPTNEGWLAEHRLRIARAERLGPHLAELALQKRRRRREGAVHLMRRRLGAALVAVGARLQGAEPTRRAAAAAPGPGAPLATN